MNIVYVMSMSSTSATSGVAKQALIWAEELRRQGHTVELYSPWSPPDWKAVDVAHFFGNGIWLAITMQTFRGAGVKRIVASPIIDSLKSPFIYKLASFMGCGRLRLFSSNYALRYVKPWVSAALVRSFYEERFLRESYGYSADKVKLLRLPARNVVERQEFNAEDKEPFCFHCSLFTQDRKNVMRLMQAAVKYNFKLVIAGTPGTEAATQPYLDMAAAHPDNIQILGRISDEQLADCYRRAKVFALPSIMEGVGFVALEAAAFGLQHCHHQHWRSQGVLRRNGSRSESVAASMKLVAP